MEENKINNARRKETKKRHKLITKPKKNTRELKSKNKKKSSERKAKISTIPEQNTKKYISDKRKKKRNRILAFLSVSLILIVTLSVLSLTVFFPIKEINVLSCKKYNPQEIISSIGIVKGDNLLLASESRAYSALEEKYSYVKSVEFDRKLPFTLNIKVNEYEVYAQIKYNNGYIRVAQDGKILEHNEKYIKGSPVVTGLQVVDNEVGKKITFANDNEQEPLYDKIEIITNAFKNSKIGGVTLINLADLQDIKVTYNDKIVMLLGSDSNLDKKLTHAKAILDVKGNSNETGTLNLSRIPSTKNEASFIPRELEAEEIAAKSKLFNKKEK